MKAQRWICVSDNHGDRADPKACEAMFDFLKHWKPDIRIHAGDCFDFRALRRKATDEERRGSLGEDLDAGMSFLRRFRPHYFLRGNHDERMYDILQSDDKKMVSLTKDVVAGIADALGDAKVFPYDKRKGVLKLGHLRVIHGYNSGIYAARQAALVYGSVIQGHVHRIDQHAIAGLERRIGRCIGALCLLDQDYNRAQLQTLSQAHGFAYGLLLPSGAYQFWQAESIDGTWHFPSEVRSYVA